MRIRWRWWQAVFVVKEIGEVTIRVIVRVRWTTRQTTRWTSSLVAMRQGWSCVVIGGLMGHVRLQ